MAVFKINKIKVTKKGGKNVDILINANKKNESLDGDGIIFGIILIGVLLLIGMSIRFGIQNHWFTFSGIIDLFIKIINLIFSPLTASDFLLHFFGVSNVFIKSISPVIIAFIYFFLLRYFYKNSEIDVDEFRLLILIEKMQRKSRKLYKIFDFMWTVILCVSGLFTYYWFAVIGLVSLLTIFRLFELGISYIFWGEFKLWL